MRKEIYHQYAHSEKLVNFINNMETFLSCGNDLWNIYNYVFNINSASGFGLDIWGDILNVSRSLNIVIDEQAQQYTMTDEEYRIILKLQALKNISDATPRSIKNSLNLVFAEYGNIYVSDLGNMKMRYTFEFLLPEIIYVILRQTNVIPRPAGVGFEIYELPSRKIFGFNGQRLENFNNGTFFQGVRE